MWGRESKVRLSDVAILMDAAKGIFEAGVAANKVEMPQQFMMTPEQILEEQKQMQTDAAWAAGEDLEPKED